MPSHDLNTTGPGPHPNDIVSYDWLDSADMQKTNVIRALISGRFVRCMKSEVGGSPGLR